MTRFRAFLREDQKFLGLYSWGWTILGGVLAFAWVLIFGPPEWLVAIIWRVFVAMVTGAAIVVLVWGTGMVLILTGGFNK